MRAEMQFSYEVDVVMCAVVHILLCYNSLFPLIDCQIAKCYKKMLLATK